MTAALPAVLEYPVCGTAGAGRGDRDRAAHPVAAHAAAVRARPHQPLAARRRRRHARSSIAATATPRRARSGSGISRRRSRRGRSGASSRPTAIPITSAMPRGCRHASEAPVAMTASEYLTAHALAGQHAGFTTRRDARPLPPARDGAPRTSPRSNREATATGAAFPSCPSRFDRLQDGDARRAAGTSWRIVEGHGHSPEHASLYSAERGVLISGDMLLPKISTNVSVCPVEPDGDPLARFLDSLSAFEALPPDTLVLPSHGLPFRGIPLRVAQLRAHHAARLGEIDDAVKAVRLHLARGGARPGAVPARARRPAAILRDGRGDRPSQSPLARGTARPPRRRRRHAAIRGGTRLTRSASAPETESRHHVHPRQDRRRERTRPEACLRSGGARRIAAHRRGEERQGHRRLRRPPAPDPATRS